MSGQSDRLVGVGAVAVNLTGTLALGILVGAAVSDDTLRLLGTGLLGSYTTFSTWALESHRLGEDGQGTAGALNFVTGGLRLAATWAENDDDNGLRFPDHLG